MDVGLPFAIVEINDSDIRVASDTDIVLRSPGYAIVGKDGVALGEAAVHQARLNPRAMQNRYWHNLNQDPLQSSTARVRHNADLAYAHLLAIHEQTGKPDNVLFAVPGYYSNEQLSLLLGLVEASPFNAIGLVDSAIAAAAPYVGPGAYVHAEIHLHQTVLTYMEVAGDVKRTSVQIVEGAGLAAVMDYSAAMITDLFIKESRFDPQHHAETEQSLYNRIAGCMLTLASRSEAIIEIPYQKSAYTAKVPRRAMLDALQPVYRRIIDALPAKGLSLVGDRLAGLPGFVEQLGAAQVLAPDSVFQGCQLHIDRIRSSGEALCFVTRLPAKAGPVVVPVPPVASESAAKPRIMDEPSPDERDDVPVTHILSGHRAYPLAGRRMYFSAHTNAISDHDEHAQCSVSTEDGRLLVQAEGGLAVFVNGKQIGGGTEVGVGDVVTFAGSKTEYSFIHVNS